MAAQLTEELRAIYEIGRGDNEYRSGERHLSCWSRLRLPVAAVTALTGRVKAGAMLFALANATLVAGHIAEGNLSRAARDLREHPVWGVRADVDVAVATVKSALE